MIRFETHDYLPDYLITSITTTIVPRRSELDLLNVEWGGGAPGRVQIALRNRAT